MKDFYNSYLAPSRKQKPTLSRGLFLMKMARVTGLEPAASCVTGMRSNQLSYTRQFQSSGHSFDRFTPQSQRGKYRRYSPAPTSPQRQEKTIINI